MLDTAAVELLIEQQIKDQVNTQVAVVLGSDEWLASFEQRIIEYVQARVMAKFANAEYLPEITDTVKSSVNELFKRGVVPGIDQYVDAALIKQTIDTAVENLVDNSIALLGKDPAWLSKVEKQIEKQINQSTLDCVVRQLSKIDLNPVIKERIDENMVKFQQDILKNFTSTGIVDQATQCQLTIMDDTTVVENQLTTRDLHIVNVATIQDLVVKGSINIDNRSWDTLANGISEKTLNKLSQEWKTTLIAQVAEQIKINGIDFDTVNIGGELLVSGNKLSKNIKETQIQTVGILRNLEVAGESTFNNKTLTVLNRRLGVNTQTPEMALSVWDEEVSVVIGKNQNNEAYIGTNRDQGVSIGVNRIPQIEISAAGLTRIKQLQIGLHKISHAPQVPGWAGTRGDLVFNINPGADRVFAWVCLGAHRWQTLKAAE
jgi:hypothetical protein